MLRLSLCWVSIEWARMGVWTQRPRPGPLTPFSVPGTLQGTRGAEPGQALETTGPLRGKTVLSSEGQWLINAFPFEKIKSPKFLMVKTLASLKIRKNGYFFINLPTSSPNQASVVWLQIIRDMTKGWGLSTKQSRCWQQNASWTVASGAEDQSKKQKTKTGISKVMVHARGNAINLT